MPPSARRENLAERFAFLRELPLFAPVNDGVLAYLSEYFRERSYRQRDIIFHEDDESQGLYIVKEGKVRIYHLDPSGDEETTVNILIPRQVIGEFALIDGQPRSATAEVITKKCVLLEISRDTFLEHLNTIPGLGLAMCQQLTKKARWTSFYAKTMAQLDVAGCLLCFILHFTEEFGQPVEGSRRYVLDLGLNQGDLATLVGANRGWVNHILLQWRDEGLLEFDRGTITIYDLLRARQLLDQITLDKRRVGE
jgi:CRP/FNR family transcriptional regulator